METETKKTGFFERMSFNNGHGTMTLGSLPFLLIQLSILLVFTTYFSWTGVLICAASYFIRMFFVTGVLHRFFSHKSYKMNRFWTFVFGWLASTTVQRGILWWGSNHRHHHAYSDKEEDLHSPKVGFWHSHWFWFLYKENTETDYNKIKDFSKHKELVWLNEFWYVPVLVYAFGLFFLGTALGGTTVGWHYVVWGFFASTVLLANGTYTINSLSHVWGKIRFHSGDTSRNNWVLAIVTLGEGWHNNHHRYMASTRNGFYWYEYDITYYIIKALSLVGITKDLKPVPEKVLAEGRKNDEARKLARKQGEVFTPVPPNALLS